MERDEVLHCLVYTLWHQYEHSGIMDCDTWKKYAFGDFVEDTLKMLAKREDFPGIPRGMKIYVESRDQIPRTPETL